MAIDGIGKKEFVQLYRERFGVTTRAANEAVTRTLDLLRDLLLDLEAVRLTDIGILYLTRVPKHKQTNNLTGAMITVPERYYVRFRPLRSVTSLIEARHARKRRKRR